MQDENLKSAKALGALQEAYQAANKIISKMLDECKTQAERTAIQESFNEVELSYLKSLKKSLIDTGPRFDNAVKDLEKKTEEVKQKTADLKEIVETIRLFEELARLAAALALAFA